MKTDQPSWHCIANLGDAAPLDHGGAFVMIDKRGTYAPELWIYTPAETEGKRGEWTTVLLELCTPIKGGADGQVSDNRFHPDHPVWFDLAGVASYVGEPLYRVSNWICSPYPVERARVYMDLVAYHGAENFGGIDRLENFAADRKRVNLLLKQIKASETWKDGI